MTQIALIIICPPIIFLFGLWLERRAYANAKRDFRISEITRRYGT